MQKDPTLKFALEGALRFNQAKHDRQEQQRATLASNAGSTRKTLAQPTIKLKMDFSNFGKK